VQEAERVGPMQLLQQLEVVGAAHPERRRGPLAHAVDREDRRLLEGGGEKRARRVRLVMLGVQDLAVIAEGAADFPVEEQLLFYPQWAGHPELREPAGRNAEVGLQNALELEEGLVIEADIGQVRGPNPGRLETIPRGVPRKGSVALLAGEAL